jgi:phosphoglucosamine mutase
MRFGTDGVRGRFGTELTPGYARVLGRSVATVLGSRTTSGEVVIGGDTRESTPVLETAVADGLASGGLVCVGLGVAPTPMVAFVAARRDAIGVVISASHNPYHDNGIKVFGPGGIKLDTATEAAIEAAIEAETTAETTPEAATGPAASAVAGDQVDNPAVAEARSAYLEHLLGVLEGRRLGSMPIVVDAANGAASHLAAEVFRRAGAVVTMIHDQPDGRNINVECGATDPESLARCVTEHGAVLGIALDGDADRLIAVDETGAVVDGDRIIAICAQDLRRRDRLANDTVVVTVMTNLGFHEAMERTGIAVVQTPVGDRAVLEAIDGGGHSLGGEQSGHIIFRDHATTGDGLLTALVLADVLARSGEPLSQLAARAMDRLPQVLINVEIAERLGRVDDDLAGEIAALETRLGGRGRVLVRPSGTEPLVRVMVEAATDDAAEELASEVAAIVRTRLA